VAASAPDRFGDLLRARLAPALRELGFVGSGSTYRLPIPESFALLGFQRSRYNDRSSVSFTLNLAAGSTATWEVARRDYPFLPKQPSTTPRYPGGLWHARLGMLLPEPRDVWWTVDRDTDLDALAAEVVTMVRDHAMPALRAHAQD
jgi:Domain of unknown function (DUF4304)